MGVALLKGQRGSRGAPVAEGGLHQVRRDEGHLQPPVRRHTSTIVHRHTSSPTTPKPYYLAPTRRARHFLSTVVMTIGTDDRADPRPFMIADRGRTGPYMGLSAPNWRS